jgi:serine/threonine-protein kinase
MRQGRFLDVPRASGEANVRVAVSELELPHRFGQYMLFDRIGQGGMAEIFLARKTTELGGGKLLVVKLILPVYAERAEFAEMLAAEAKLAATLTHANIVQIVDLGREENRLFIAMEYVEGFDLAALLKRCSKEKVPLPPEFALHVVMELFAGLDYAGKKKIVHRDVSPSNVLVSFDGEVKLCDFGIARANDSLEAKSEAIKGKAGYMSPEHARGDALDARADVFAAGIILWELLAGRKLYRAGEGGDLIEQARAANIPDLPSRGFPNEEELHAIVRRALAVDAEKRFATAGDARRALHDWAAGAKLLANPLRLGEWLTEHFGAEILAQRRAREAAAKSLDPSPKPAPAIGTPAPPRIAYKEEEPSPESLSPIDVSPLSKTPPAKTSSTPWALIVVGLVVASVVVWLLARSTVLR